jgi:DDE superfamily endonuclease
LSPPYILDGGGVASDAGQLPVSTAASRGEMRSAWCTPASKTVIGRTIKLVLDNHSAHVSKETNTWLAAQSEGRFTFVFTPKHGSWLNLVEGFISKLGPGGRKFDGHQCVVIQRLLGARRQLSRE